MPWIGFYCVDSLQNFTATCLPTFGTDNDCVRYHGVMHIFLADDTTVDASTYLVRSVLRDLLQDVSFVSGVGLVRAEYLGPTLVDPAPILGAQTTGRDASIEGNSLSSTSLAFTIAGAAALVAIVAAVFYVRKGQHDNDEPLSLYPSDSTQGQSLESSQVVLDRDRPTSPFSEMLPKAYRFSGNLSVLSGSNQSGLSMVPEVESSSSESVVVSESGYSTEAGESDATASFCDLPKSLYTKDETPLLLGATQRMSDGVSDVSESPAGSPRSQFLVGSLLDESVDLENHVLFE